MTELVLVVQLVTVFILVSGTVSLSPHEVESDGCPPSPWFSRTNGTCSCVSLPVVQCNSKVNHLKLQVQLGYCMTWDGEVRLRACPYFSTNIYPRPNNQTLERGFYDVNLSISERDLTNWTCGMFNRQRTNCERCIEGHGPAIFSDSVTCVECSKYKFVWFAYLVLQLLLETLLLIALAVLKPNKAFSVINVLTFYWQMIFYAITTSSFLYGKLQQSANPKVLHFLLTIYGVWNLDFVRYLLPFMCITDTTRAINTLLVDFVVALYPLMVCGILLLGQHMHKQNNRVIAFLLRPLGRLLRREWDLQDSIITTFAIFFVLSYSKLLFTSLKLLNGVHVYNKNGTLADSKLLLYYDPSIRYLSPLHAPYIIVSALVLITVILIPPILLLIHSIRICRNRMGFRRSEFLSKTIDTFQGSYKDGSEGTYDYRMFSALYMFLKIGIACEYTFVVVNYHDNKSAGLPWAITGLALIGFGAIYFTVEPFRASWKNKFDGFVLTLLGLLALTITFDDVFVYAIALALSLKPWAIVGTANATKLLRWTLNTTVAKRMKRKLKTKFQICFKKSGNQYHKEEEPLLEETLSDNMPDRVVNPFDYLTPELHSRGEASQRTRSMSVPTYGVV